MTFNPVEHDEGNSGEGPGRGIVAERDEHMAAFDQLPRVLRDEFNYAINEWAVLDTWRRWREEMETWGEGNEDELVEQLRKADGRDPYRVTRPIMRRRPETAGQRRARAKIARRAQLLTARFR